MDNLNASFENPRDLYYLRGIAAADMALEIVERAKTASDVVLFSQWVLGLSMFIGDLNRRLIAAVPHIEGLPNTAVCLPTLELHKLCGYTIKYVGHILSRWCDEIEGFNLLDEIDYRRAFSSLQTTQFDRRPIEFRVSRLRLKIRSEFEYRDGTCEGFPAINTT